MAASKTWSARLVIVYVAGEGWSGFQGSVQIDGGINEDWLKDNARCIVREATAEAVTAGVDVIGTTAVSRDGTGSDGAGRADRSSKTCELYK